MQNFFFFLKKGYVLQPFYKEKKIVFPYTKLEIEIISARQLPRTGETSDPFISVSLHFKDQEIKHDTKVVDNNGFNPKWGEKFTFELTEIEHSILLFVMKDKDTLRSKPMGQYSLPLYCIRPGYRIIHLEDSQDNKIYGGGANLLVHVSLN